MGSDPAPFFTHLFLFYYEWQYVKNLKKNNIISAQTFCHTFIFTDDPITINFTITSNFRENIGNIYPVGLEFKKIRVQIS